MLEQNHNNDEQIAVQQQEKLRYSDVELADFKQLIDEKLEQARQMLIYYQEQIKRQAEDPEKTGLESGADALEKEYLNHQASRQIGFIQDLERALARIENKTYGICRVTGKLIPKERLRLVPHATLSMEAKQQQKQPLYSPPAIT